MKDKVILAYSGGLDTTAIIPWLKENYNYDVVCCCIDVGQESELDGLEERAKLSGAEKLYILDVVDEFVDDYILPTVMADAVYEHKYLLGTSLRARSSLRSLLRLPARRTLSQSATVQQARVMIRFVLSFQSRLWHLISRLSLLGDATRHGRCSHVRMRLITAGLMV